MLPADNTSHINSETPGSIHEGGELGYALAVSFGAVMDNPDLIVACVVGDGEAETGPTATYGPLGAWSEPHLTTRQRLAWLQVHRPG